MEKKFHPLAVNIMNLQKYNLNDLTLQEVILFDYFVIKGKSFKFKEFYYCTRKICVETGIKKHSVEKILKKFEELKILNIRRYGMPVTKYFIVDYQSIAEQLPVLYNLQKGGTDFEHSLVEFYRSLIENSQQKNIKKENFKKREEEIEIERSSILKSFQDFLVALQLTSSANRSIFKFEEFIFFKALDKYEFEEIKEAVHIFFHANFFQKNLKDFFGLISITGQIEYIEKKREKQNLEVQKFVNELDMLYNQIRLKLSKESKIYPATKLSVTFKNVAQIKDLLKIMSKDQIKNSFIAYIHRVTTGELKVKKLLSYFLTKKGEDYEVILSYLELYNQNYVIQ